MGLFEQEEAAVLLREEMDAIMEERAKLLRAVGAAAVLVSNLDETNLPEDHDALVAAEMLAAFLNDLPEETLSDALESVMDMISTPDEDDIEPQAAGSDA